MSDIDHVALSRKLLDHDGRLAALEARGVGGLEGMTLAEIESMAARLGAAAKTIRDAQSLLNPQPIGQAISPSGATTSSVGPSAPADGPIDPIAAHRLRQLQPVVIPGAPVSQLTPAEQAEKRRHMQQFERVDDPNLPDEIRAMERGE